MRCAPSSSEHAVGTVALGASWLLLLLQLGLAHPLADGACFAVKKGQVAPTGGAFVPGGTCPSCTGPGSKHVAKGQMAGADGSFCPDGPAPPPRGNGTCCFLSMGETCAKHVAAMCPSIPNCETKSACTGICSATHKGTWCPGDSPGPPAPPSPPPSPPSPGATCAAALEHHCPMLAGLPQTAECEQCASAHQPALRQAGCTQPMITGFCSGFESSCASTQDFGWPRFQNATALKASPWGKYFTDVYGELPTTYPICVYDFWYLHKDAYLAAGLDKSSNKPIVQDPKAVKEGDLFVENLGGFFGGNALQIYHGQWQPAPNNSWVEITHTVLPTELQGDWVWRLRGSNTWFNVGSTVVFPGDNHMTGINVLSAGCSKQISPLWPQVESDVFGFCAREKGYDSVQFEPDAGAIPLGSFGLPGLVEIVMVNLDGNFTCGTQNASATPLRAGWHGSRPCECENEAIDPACGMSAYPPAPMHSATPPICKLQGENPLEPCNPNKCKPTACKKPTRQ